MKQQQLKNIAAFIRTYTELLEAYENVSDSGNVKNAYISLIAELIHEYQIVAAMR